MRWSFTRAGCPFERLFQNEWGIRGDAPIDSPIDSRKLIDLTVGRWSAFPDLLSAADPELYVRHFNWLILPDFFPHHRPLQERCVQLVGELSLAPALATRVDEFKARFFRPRMIGVHLRRGDLTLARPDATNNLLPAIQATDGFLASFPDAGILLCTDDGAPTPISKRKVQSEGIVEKFVARYGDRVVRTMPRTLDRRLPEATEDALVELWLLRQVDYFVGTLVSSFSEMAVFGRSIPAAMTAGPTMGYQEYARRLKAVGAYGLVRRITIHEFGHEAPLGLLVWRKRLRLQSLLAGMIPPSIRARMGVPTPRHAFTHLLAGQYGPGVINESNQSPGNEPQ